MSSEPCDGCGDTVADALARTVRLSVDRSNIDTQRLCPECFANWIAHYQNEMSSEPTSSPTADGADGEAFSAPGSDEPVETASRTSPENEEEEDDSTDIIVD